MRAQDYIDSETVDPAALQQRQAISGGLGVNGTLMLIGAVGALTVNSLDLITKRASVKGWYSGTAIDSEDTLLFGRLNDTASMNEVFHSSRHKRRIA